MSKGEQTHQMIVERAAQVFNRQGYFGASLSDLMRETGSRDGRELAIALGALAEAKELKRLPDGEYALDGPD